MDIVSFRSPPSGKRGPKLQKQLEKNQDEYNQFLEKVKEACNSKTVDALDSEDGNNIRTAFEKFVARSDILVKYRDNSGFILLKRQNMNNNFTVFEKPGGNFFLEMPEQRCRLATLDYLKDKIEEDTANSIFYEITLFCSSGRGKGRALLVEALNQIKAFDEDYFTAIEDETEIFLYASVSGDNDEKNTPVRAYERNGFKKIEALFVKEQKDVYVHCKQCSTSSGSYIDDGCVLDDSLSGIKIKTPSESLVANYNPEWFEIPMYVSESMLQDAISKASQTTSVSDPPLAAQDSNPDTDTGDGHTPAAELKSITNIETIQDGKEAGQTMVMRGNYNGEPVVIKVMGLQEQTGAIHWEDEIELTKQVGEKEFGPKVIDVWENQPVPTLKDNVIQYIHNYEDEDDDDTYSFMILEDLVQSGFQDVENMSLTHDQKVSLAEKIAQKHAQMSCSTGIYHDDLYRYVGGRNIVHNIFVKETNDTIDIRFIDFGFSGNVGSDADEIYEDLLTHWDIDEPEVEKLADAFRERNENGCESTEPAAEQSPDGDMTDQTDQEAQDLNMAATDKTDDEQAAKPAEESTAIDNAEPAQQPDQQDSSVGAIAEASQSFPATAAMVARVKLCRVVAKDLLTHYRCKHGRCVHMKTNGKRCRVCLTAWQSDPANPKYGYCASHAMYAPN